MRSVVPQWSRLVAAAAALGPGVAVAGEFPGPVDLSGAVTYSVQELRQGTGERSLQQAGTATLNYSTYFYEPWLVSTAGSLSLSKTASSGDSSSGSNVVTGNIAFNVLPQSSYPVELYYSRYNRNVQLGEDFSTLTGQSARLTSTVTLEDDWSVNTRLNVEEAADEEGLSEMSEEAQLEVSKLFVEDHLRVGLLHRGSAYGVVGVEDDHVLAEAGASNNSVTVRYRSHPFDTVTTDSTSTLRVSEYSDSKYVEESQVMQGVTTAIWRPVELDKDLVVHGAMRTFQQKATLTQVDVGEVERNSTTAFGTLSTTYVFQPRLMGSAGLNAGYMANEDSTSIAIGSDTGARNLTSFTMGGNVGLDYSSEVSDLGGFDWSWDTSGRTEAASNTELGLSHTETARIGHTGNRKIDLFIADNVNFSLSQHSGLGFSSVKGATIPLSHGTTLSKTSRDGKLWNFWNFSASDSRGFGGDSSVYQLLNLQVTEGYDVDRFSQWSASLTFQSARQSSATEDTGFVDTLNGQITYRQRNVFGVENLGFSSDLAFNPPSILKSRRDEQRVFISDRKDSALGSQRWSNRLDYYIGQLRAGITSRILNNENGLSMMNMFQVSRRF